MSDTITQTVRAVTVLVGLLAAHVSIGGDGTVLAEIKGADFTGGGCRKFGSTQYGQRHVNFVYASPTADFAAMEAEFEAETSPAPPTFLHVLGCNNDIGGQCSIRVALNGTVLFEGPNEFASAVFQWRTFAIPSGALRVGLNRLRLENTEAEGSVGQPPWFMLAKCVVGPENVALNDRLRIEQDFFIDLPASRDAVPPPAPASDTQGFTIRGTKGWLWLPEQYMAELPTLAACGGNFLMVCYGSMWNIEGHPEWPENNAWWLPLPEKKRQAYLQLLRACGEHGVELCFSMNPNLSSSRILDYDTPGDIDALWQHYHWFQAQGMKWFSICLDDISEGVDAAGQAKTVNAVFARLRETDPEARMIFCPTAYWGDGSGSSADYLHTLATDLHEDVFLFWTGDRVVTPTITREAAERYRTRCKHRLIIWDNYPVNDGHLTLHLGPVTGRDPALPEVCYGYMSNPMKTQSEINRIPLKTCMEYARNPVGYDPRQSIVRAILSLGRTTKQQEALRLLVELFPGMLVYGKGTGYNPVLDRFETTLDTPHSRHLAAVYLDHVEDVASRLEDEFPDGLPGARTTLRQITDRMRLLYTNTYGTPPRPQPRR